MTHPPQAVCAHVWSKAEHFRQRLGRLATLGNGAAVAANNVELVFWVPFLCPEALRVGGIWREVGSYPTRNVDHL